MQHNGLSGWHLMGRWRSGPARLPAMVVQMDGYGHLRAGPRFAPERQQATFNPATCEAACVGGQVGVAAAAAAPAAPAPCAPAPRPPISAAATDATARIGRDAGAHPSPARPSPPPPPSIGVAPVCATPMPLSHRAPPRRRFCHPRLGAPLLLSRPDQALWQSPGPPPRPPPPCAAPAAALPLPTALPLPLRRRRWRPRRRCHQMCRRPARH
jgi:hypothetical protein